MNRKAGSESDYKMNLLEVRDSGKYIFNNTDVQSVFEITRETFAGHFDAIREKYGDKQGGGQYVYGAGKVNRRWKKRGDAGRQTYLGQKPDGRVWGWKAEQAMDALKISQEDRNKYAGMLKKQ